MKITNNMLDFIESRDFYQVYESGGEKRICFSGYIYPADDDWRVLEYCQVDFLLKDYLANSKVYDDCIVSCTQYIDEVPRSEALKTANSWYDDGKGATPLRLSSLSMSTPCGEYIDADERELSLIDYMMTGLYRQGAWEIDIKNIRMQEDGAFFDLSYKWQLNSWEKHAKHKQTFAGYKDDVWFSSIVYFPSNELGINKAENSTMYTEEPER